MGTRGWPGPDVARAQEAFVIGGEADDRAELWDMEPTALERQLPRPLRLPRQSAVLVGSVQGEACFIVAEASHSNSVMI